MTSSETMSVARDLAWIGYGALITLLATGLSAWWWFGAAALLAVAYFMGLSADDAVYDDGFDDGFREALSMATSVVNAYFLSDADQTAQG